MDELIRKAISQKRLLRFSYGGRVRVAEPHVYGTISGRKQLLTYQIAGESSSGDLPNWRRVELDGMRDLQILEDRFSGPRPTGLGEHSQFDVILAVVS